MGTHDTSLLTVVVVMAGVAGLVVGSFLNVVVYRVPLGLSVSKPRSFCPDCHRQLAWWENVPLISWIVLRGRCRVCGLSISLRYPAVELATGLVFALVAWAWRGTLPAAGYCCLAASMIAILLIECSGHRAPWPWPGLGPGSACPSSPPPPSGRRTGGRSSARWPERSSAWPSSPSSGSLTPRLVTLERPVEAPCSLPAAGSAGWRRTPSSSPPWSEPGPTRSAPWPFGCPAARRVRVAPAAGASFAVSAAAAPLAVTVSAALLAALVAQGWR